jgi:putative endonuclease
MILNMGKKRTAKELGKWGENLAKSFLEEKGYQVIFCNYFTEYGEIDIIASKDNHIHFVEVKTRRTKQFGHPEEAITNQKLAHMIDSAEAFLQSHPEFDGDWQMDVIAIQISEIKDSPDIRLFPNV